MAPLCAASWLGEFAHCELTSVLNLVMHVLRIEEYMPHVKSHSGVLYLKHTGILFPYFLQLLRDLQGSHFFFSCCTSSSPIIQNIVSCSVINEQFTVLLDTIKLYLYL